MRYILVWLFLLLCAGNAQAQDASTTAQPTPNYDWREDDTQQSYVDRLRRAAYGTTCETERSAFEQLASGLKVEFGSDQAVAGKGLKFTWSRGELPADLPATWLILSVDQPMRFTGEGIYALTPNAIAPFGLDAGAGQTRAFVAIYGPGAPENGPFELVPLLAGKAKVSVQLASWSAGCWQEVVSNLAAAELTVNVSPEPVFFVRDPFSFERPARLLASADGASLIEDYGNRWRLVDNATGAVLSEREGSDPAFSPTGRFAAALTGDYREVLDTVDGSLVATIEEGDIGWENSDSFVVTAGAQNGAIDAYSPLVKDYRLDFGEGTLDCTVCTGLTTRISLDLENDVALRIGGQGMMISRLSGSRDLLFQPLEDTSDEELMAQANAAVDGFVLERTLALPLGRPEHWNFRGGLMLTSRISDLEPVGDEAFDRWQQRVGKSMMANRDAPVRREMRADALTISEIGRSRGANALGRPKVRSDALTSRLAESGLVFIPSAPPAFARPEGSGAQDAKADLAIARRIEKTNPAIKGIFQSQDFGCVPDGDSAATPKIYATFDNAYQFKAAGRDIWLTLFSCKWNSGGAYEPNFFLFDRKLPNGFVRLGGENPNQPNSGICTGGLGFCPVDARLVANRYLLMWSKASRAAQVYDLDSQRTLFQRFDLESGQLTKELACTASCREIAQINSDGSFYLYDAASTEQLLEGRYVDDETVMWTPDLRFESSAEGANYVNLRFPGQAGQHTFQQFSAALRRSDLISGVLSRNRKAEGGGIGAPPRLNGELSVEGGRIRGNLASWGGKELRIYQDGLLTDTLQAHPDGEETQVDLKRLPGARHISVVAADKDGLVSLPAGRVLPRDAADALPVVHALTIGIDNYASKQLSDLQFAARDANTLSSALRAIDGRSVKLASAVNLTGEAASHDAILARAREIVAAAKIGETIMVSFAGHGLTGPDGRFYMALPVTDPTKMHATALAWDELSPILATARARVVVFLDACHSGAAGTSFFATNDAAAGKVLETMPSGLLVFSASKGRQLSEENASSGGGVFTNAVADVIARKRANFDLDGNGAIEVSELYAGVKLSVSNATDGRQVPWLARNELVGDFALF